MVGSTTPQDMATIRKILQAFISLDYDGVVDGLEDLRFLLPTANKHNIRQALEKAVTFYLETDIDTVDTKLIEKVLQDIQLLVKNEPIQLPAEFAFFGRAASTLLGILQILDSKIDLFTLGKPIVIQWLEADGTTIQNRYVMTALNYGKKLLNVPPLLDNYLKEPTRKRLSEQAMFQRELESKELLHRQTFNAGLIILGLVVGLFVSGCSGQVASSRSSLISTQDASVERFVIWPAKISASEPVTPWSGGFFLEPRPDIGSDLLQIPVGRPSHRRDLETVRVPQINALVLDLIAMERQLMP